MRLRRIGHAGGGAARPARRLPSGAAHRRRRHGGRVSRRRSHAGTGRRDQDAAAPRTGRGRAPSQGSARDGIVTHPNLAVVHGIETWQGIPFLVEEYLAGGTLAQLLSHGRPALADAIRLGVTLADVLANIHAAGILHCDVKPGNIGFTQGGVVKLLDFGLARLLRDARVPADMSTTRIGHYTPVPVAASASGVLAGTPYYMSPEAVRGERPTPAFDVWALSVVLYEVLAGRRPFEGSDSNEIFTRILADARPDLSLAYPRCPPEITAAFARLFSLNPAVRPMDARALRRELESLQVAVG